MAEIGLLGFGTVGQGVYEIINLKRGVQVSESDKFHIKKILVRDKSRKRNLDIPDDMLTVSFEDIINDGGISIVVCVMGGEEPEYSYIKQALSAKKHVVTANKEVIASHIDELLSLAKQNGVHILFEASVGGGIPIISSLTESLKINKITKITGILNGTTNFILTKLVNERRSFADILAEAQKLGFAEADPSADIDGYDILRKISILGSIAFKTKIKENNVHLRGIGNITLDDVVMASSFGYKIKYIGQALLDGARYSVSVTPVMIHTNSVVANVDAEYNVVLIKGNIIGELCFIGRGAGKDATANAVVSDIIKIYHSDVDYSHISFDSDVDSYGLEGITNEYYIRANAADYKEFSRIINSIGETVKKNKITYKNNKLYFITERIFASDMKNLYNHLKKISSDVFYARLDNDLL